VNDKQKNDAELAEMKRHNLAMESKAGVEPEPSNVVGSSIKTVSVSEKQLV
jgi:hypothetical protein